jgi:SpoIID/LytB domain protein
VTPAKIDKELKGLEAAGRIKITTLLPGYQGPNDILQLEASEVGPSGRVWSLAVRLKNGHLGVLTRSQSFTVRNGLGISSSLYSLPARGTANSQTVVGHGFGHGVGLSQWGADALGDSGQSYDRILSFYFQNTKLETLLFN